MRKETLKQEDALENNIHIRYKKMPGLRKTRRGGGKEENAKELKLARFLTANRKALLGLSEDAEGILQGYDDETYRKFSLVGATRKAKIIVQKIKDLAEVIKKNKYYEA